MRHRTTKKSLKTGSPAATIAGRCVVVSTFLILAIGPLLPFGCAQGVTDRSQYSDLQSVLDSVLRDESSALSDVDNSRVVVENQTVKLAVSNGIDVIPLALDKMRQPGLSFDQFTRLYSVCDQILVNTIGEYAYWTGGASTREEGGRVLIEPLAQLDEEEFRLHVIRDISAKYDRAKAQSQGR